jgi:hypothetical protein
MDARAEHVRREAEVWAEFEGALARIPDERLSDPGALPGWSVKEMLWHVAGWMREAADHLARMREGTYAEPEDSDEITDARNAAFAEQARAMDVAAVRSGLDDARELLLRRWSELPTADEVAVEWFAGETYEHYEEHLPDLRRVADGP